MISSGTIGNIKLSSGSISTSKIADGAITSSLVNLAMRGWTFTGTFSATDYNTVAWTTGTFTASDGTSYSIGSGNTGNISALTYIYLDIAVSETVLQTTTTATTAVGNGKVLIAVAQNNSDTTSKAIFQVFGGSGGNSVMVDNIVANSASTNEFISNSAQLANAVVTNAKINTVSFDKATGGTLTLGGSGNVSGVFSLKDSTGAEKIAMDNAGMTINSGKITIKDATETSIIDSTGLISTANFTVASATANPNQTVDDNDTWVDITGLTSLQVGPSRTVNVLVVIGARGWINSDDTTSDFANYSYLGLAVDDVIQNYSLVQGANRSSGDDIGTSVFTFSGSYFIQVTSGNHTLKLRAKCTNVAGAQSNFFVQYGSYGYIILGT